MLGQEVSWTERSPPNNKSHSSIQQPQNSKLWPLPPLQPLIISRKTLSKWPEASYDDLGIWPSPQTPRNLEQSVREFQFKKEKLSFFDKECSRIADHIYLGSDSIAKNFEVLKHNEISHVLNCVGFVCPEYFKNNFVYKTLWLQDSPSEDITSILYDVFDYFEDVREQNGRVFVHCCQGVSRSTSLVIAYLMWKKNQSFKDAFQYVKAARGVANPNRSFAFQLLQCQKRVHDVLVSPDSILRMYRIGPHSSYDPLRLVPKMLNIPGKKGLDSRGAFIVQLPYSIFVWVGKDCDMLMSKMARVAAFRFVRYERAKGPVVRIDEGKEPVEFWDALENEKLSSNVCDKLEFENETPSCGDGNKRQVDEYDLDFGIFYKALSNGVVPPISIATAQLEDYHPMMKELTNPSKLSCEITSHLGENYDTIEQPDVLLKMHYQRHHCPR